MSSSTKSVLKGSYSGEARFSRASYFLWSAIGGRAGDEIDLQHFLANLGDSVSWCAALDIYSLQLEFCEFKVPDRFHFLVAGVWFS